MKAFADDNINENEKFQFILGRVENIVGISIHSGKGRKHYGKRRKCWFPAFSPFPTLFSKGYFLKVIKSRDCVVKS